MVSFPRSFVEGNVLAILPAKFEVSHTKVCNKLSVSDCCVLVLLDHLKIHTNKNFIQDHQGNLYHSIVTQTEMSRSVAYKGVEFK